MSAAVAINLQEAPRLAETVPSAPRVREAVEKLKELTRAIEALDPAEITPDLKKVLAKLAEISLRRPPIPAALRFGCLAAQLWFRDEKKLLASFIDAGYQLRRAVLDAIERADTAYESEKLDAVQSALESLEVVKPMEAEEFRGWLERLQDRSLP